VPSCRTTYPAARVTVDLGLRYDFEQLPTVFNQDTNNFSPRIGLAFSPEPRWVFRAGYGIFHDRQILANLNRAIAEDGVHGFSRSQMETWPRLSSRGMEADHSFRLQQALQHRSFVRNHAW